MTKTILFMTFLLSVLCQGCLFGAEPKIIQDTSEDEFESDSGSDKPSDSESESEGCPNGWTGDDCDVCPGNWDETADCAVCVGNWTGDDCEVCPENFDNRDRTCTRCANEWTGDACDVCPDHYDPTNNCDGCLNAWEGSTCSSCPGNWDETQDCAVCRNQWTGEDCDECPENWSAADDCAVCEGGRIGEDCEICPGNWDPEKGCASCRNNWEGEDCEICPGYWDEAADCAECRPGRVDNNDDCGRCVEGRRGENCDICVRLVDVYVDLVQDGTLNPVEGGLSGWDNAFLTIQEGIDSAGAAVAAGEAEFCEVWVRNCYTGRSTICQLEHHLYDPATQNGLVLRPGVHLYGDFTGTELTLEDRVLNKKNILYGHSESDWNDESKHLVVAANNSLIDGFHLYSGGVSVGSEQDVRGGGIYAEGVENFTVSKCEIGGFRDSLEGAAIYVGNSTGVKIVNCEIDSNGKVLESGDEVAAVTIRNSEVQMVHNTVVRAYDLAVETYDSPATRIQNSIFWDRVDRTTLIENKSGAAPTVAYCDIMNYEGEFGTTNFDADPLFYTEGSFWWLTEQSPCIGRADPAVAPAFDVYGLPRDDAPDIGAHEFVPE